MSKIIHEFFAVTGSSIYKVGDIIDEKGCPLIEVIATKGKVTSSDKNFANSSHVGIMLKTGILFFPSSSRQREPEFVSERQRRKKTPPIVALFLNVAEATKCFKSENLVNCDTRWEKETLETLKAIGKNHPVFVLSILEGPSCFHQKRK